MGTRPAVSFGLSQRPGSVRPAGGALRASPHLCRLSYLPAMGSDPGRARSTVVPGVVASASTLLLAGLLAVASSAGAATPHNAVLVTPRDWVPQLPTGSGGHSDQCRHNSRRW